MSIKGVGQNTQIRSNMDLGSVNEAVVAKHAKLIESALNLADKAISLSNKIVDKMGKPASDSPGITAGGCFPTEKPNPADSLHRTPELKVDKDGKIHTPGGYTIEQLGQFEWKISGPDGKSTRVWGDPHVDESDGGKFDFKRDTAFVLGDGTQINVTCKPWGNGMTVTGQLDVVCGDAHVRVTDIDKGKGKVGEVKMDGQDEVVRFNSTGKPTDVLEMGKETDDWKFEGHEVIGSENGGEVFKTAKDPLITGHRPVLTGGNTTKQAQRDEQMKALQDLFKSLGKFFETLGNATRSKGFNPFRRQDDFGSYDRKQHRNGLEQSFKAITTMFQALDQLSRLNDMVRRGPQNF